MGPVKQYTDEPSDEPTDARRLSRRRRLVVAVRRRREVVRLSTGALMRIAMTWRDATRRLTLRLAPGSRMLPPVSRPITVRLAGTQTTRSVTFTGQPVDVRL